MVSTRGPRWRHFEKGEKVLCYEPDPTKAKVLYDSKILGTVEARDKRGRKIQQYKVHFQGWSSSWDRKVNADFILKDNEANRQLQRELAEKAQLQLGSYLYRKERHHGSRKRTRKPTGFTVLEELISSGGCTSTTTITADDHITLRIRPLGLSEDNFSICSAIEKHVDHLSMRDEYDSTSMSSSSIESIQEEDRIMLHVSERLRQYLEYDYDMVVLYKRQHALPSRIPIVAILENFVKQSAIKLAFSGTNAEGGRRRSTQQRGDKKERDYENLVANVNMLKEVADGLRIYFDFTVADYLLYREEIDYASWYLAEENLNDLNYISSPDLLPLILNPEDDNVLEKHESQEPRCGVSASATTTTTQPPAESQKRKLRSHRSDSEVALEHCLSSIASTSSNAQVVASNLQYIKSLQSMGLNVSQQTQTFLQNVLAWRILPTNSQVGPSMIFGAPHLARLIVKLPEFLNASPMPDDKLKNLIKHLETFVNFLEARKDWFNEDNYAQTNVYTMNTVEHLQFKNEGLLYFKQEDLDPYQYYLQKYHQHPQSPSHAKQQHQQEQQEQHRCEVSSTDMYVGDPEKNYVTRTIRCPKVYTSNC